MIRLHLFGVPDLRTPAGNRVFTVLAQPKQVALLAILCAARRGTVRRDRLLALLWPDLEEARARNSLSKAIHHCRRALGESAIGGRFAEEIALDDAAWSCDLWDFEAALAASDRDTAVEIALRGEFVDGLQVSDSVAMEQWIDAERTRIRRLAAAAALALAETREASGELERASDHLRVAVTLSGLDESMLRRRLALFDRMGDRARALEAFADFRAQLRRDLDVDVSPETLALVDTIRQRATALPSAAASETTSKWRPVPLPTERADAATVTNSQPAPIDRALPAELAGPPSSSSRDATTPTASNAVGSLDKAGLSRPVSRRTRRGATVALLTSALAAGLGYARSQLAVRPSDPRRVVVTPFVNQTTDSALTPLGELAADMLTASLTRAGATDVADGRTRMRTGLSTVAGDTQGSDASDIADRARRAGFNTIITGRYYVTNGVLSIFAQIRSSDVSAPAVRFAEEQGPAADPVPVLRRVEQRLLGAFATITGTHLAAATTTAAATPTYAAYVEYSGGLRPWTDGDVRTAVAHFERAYRLDSNFVSVVPLLYEALLRSGRSESADSLLTRFESRRHLLAPYDQAQLTYIADFNRGDREGMYQATQRMVQLAPHAPDAQWSRGFAAATTNRFEEALAAFTAAEVDRWWTHDNLFASVHWQSISYHLLGRHDAELSVVHSVMSRHPFESDACMYELRAMAPISSVMELERALDGCIAASGGTDTLWRAKARLMLSTELRTHDRPREARQLAGTAVTLFRRALVRDGATLAAREGLASALMELGQWDEALTLLEPMTRAQHGDVPPRFAANAAIVAGKLGRTALADDMLLRLTARQTSAFVDLQRARVFAHLGRTDAAISALRTAIAAGLSATELFHANFGLEPLRRLPEYRVLVQPRR